ncbi:MAG: transcription/translation regulatory transformer protein RfaH [Sedimenticola sp.]
MDRWYAVQTKPSQEQVAYENLGHQGYRCFFPKCSKWRTRRRRRYLSVEALFPGYLFVSLDLGHTNIGPIRSTRGVSKLVRFGSRINAVPQPVMRALIEQVDDKGVLPQVLDDFTPGQQVCIEDGPFAGCTAMFQAKSSEERVILLLSLLGGERRVTLPAASVKKI